MHSSAAWMRTGFSSLIAIFFFFFLYELLERERGGEMRDGASVKFAIEDLLGSLPESVEDVGA